MKKSEFLRELQQYLDGSPAAEAKKSIEYYAEMIDERMEDGLSEEEAVAALGPAEAVAAQIRCEMPKEEKKVWNTVMLILGAPLWIPLLAAAGIVVLSFYLVLFVLEASLWIVFGSFGLAALIGLAAAVLEFMRGSSASGLVGIGLAFVLAALCLAGIPFALWSARKLTWLILASGKKIKNLFIKKEKQYE